MGISKKGGGVKFFFPDQEKIGPDQEKNFPDQKKFSV